MSIKRTVVPGNAPDPAQFKSAIMEAIQVAKASGVNSFDIITSTKDFKGIAEDVLGRNAVQSLKNRGTVKLPSGVAISHHSTQTIMRARRPEIAIALYLDKESILKVDDLAIQNLIYVPYTAEEGDEWANKWNANILGAANVANKPSLSTEVTAALTSLTAYVNPSTGLQHPSDLRLAKEKLAGLYAKSEKWSSNEIEKWAVQNQWKPSQPAELAKLLGNRL